MEVTLEMIEPYIGLIQIRRPEVLNALNWQAMKAFSAAVELAHSHSELRALLITGSGDRAFCAGGDLRELSGFSAEEDGQRLTGGMTEALRRVEELPCPVIAAVNGVARGGGGELALACDIRVFARNADLGFSQVTLALSPGWGGGQRLLHLVGYSKALEWLTTGHILTAEEALATGVANRIAAQGKALEAALALAREISAHPPMTVQAIKQLLRKGVTDAPDEAAAFEQSLFPPLWAAAEHLRLVEAFLSRKKPQID